MNKKLVLLILICTWASAQGQIGFYGKYSVGYYNGGTNFIEDHLNFFWVLAYTAEPNPCEYLLKIDSTGKVKKRYYFINNHSPYDLVEFNNRIYVSGEIGLASYLAVFDLDGELISEKGYSSGIYNGAGYDLVLNKTDSTLMVCSTQYYKSINHSIFLQKFDTLGNSIWYKYLSIPNFDIQASHLFWNAKTNTYTISVFNERNEYRMVEIDTAANILSIKRTLRSKLLYNDGGGPRLIQLNNGTYMYNIAHVNFSDTLFAPQLDVGIIYSQSGDSISTHIFGYPYDTNYLGIEIQHGQQNKDGSFYFALPQIVVKLDSNFNLLWKKDASGITKDVLYPTIKTIATHDGGCAIFGNSTISAILQNIFILKLNEFGTVGLHEISNKLENEITVYPNPANTEINITTPTKNTTYTFTNMYGELISKGKSQHINTSSLANGIYFITLYDEEQNILGTEKVLINHE